MQSQIESDAFHLSFLHESALPLLNRSHKPGNDSSPADRSHYNNIDHNLDINVIKFIC